MVFSKARGMPASSSYRSIIGTTSTMMGRGVRRQQRAPARQPRQPAARAVRVIFSLDFPTGACTLEKTRCQWLIGKKCLPISGPDLLSSNLHGAFAAPDIADQGGFL